MRVGWPDVGGQRSSAARPKPDVTLVLIGGQRLLREATAGLLAAQDGLQVLGTYESAAHFLAVGPEESPHVLLLYCPSCDRTGWREALKTLSSASISSRVVMVCADVHADLIGCAIEHKVNGVILESYSSKYVQAVITYVAGGRTIMPAGWQRAVAGRATGNKALSPRHRQVLALIAEGRGNQEIATRLGLSPNTVKFHVQALYVRLGVRNRVDAANRYVQMVSGEDAHA